MQQAVTTIEGLPFSDREIQRVNQFVESLNTFGFNFHAEYYPANPTDDYPYCCIHVGDWSGNDEDSIEIRKDAGQFAIYADYAQTVKRTANTLDALLTL